MQKEKKIEWTGQYSELTTFNVIVLSCSVRFSLVSKHAPGTPADPRSWKFNSQEVKTFSFLLYFCVFLSMVPLQNSFLCLFVQKTVTLNSKIWLLQSTCKQSLTLPYCLSSSSKTPRIEKAKMSHLYQWVVELSQARGSVSPSGQSRWRSGNINKEALFKEVSAAGSLSISRFIEGRAIGSFSHSLTLSYWIQKRWKYWREETFKVTAFLKDKIIEFSHTLPNILIASHKQSSLWTQIFF